MGLKKKDVGLVKNKFGGRNRPVTILELLAHFFFFFENKELFVHRTKNLLAFSSKFLSGSDHEVPCNYQVAEGGEL